MDYGRNQITSGSRGDGITQVIDAESTMNTVSYTHLDVYKRQVFTIPAPVMYDASGVSSTDVSYELKEAENGSYLFTIIAVSYTHLPHM